MTDSTSSVEEWRRSVDKTLRYYKDKTKKLKSSYKSQLKRLQTSFHREKRVLNNKIKTLQNKNEILQRELNEGTHVLQKEIRFLQKQLKHQSSIRNIEEKEGESTEDETEEEHEINIHKVFDYGSNYIHVNKYKSKKSLENNYKKNIKYTTNKHSLRLAKWIKTTNKLINGYKTCKSSGYNQKISISQYKDYKQLMAEQEAKMGNVSNYVSDLITQKQKIQNLIKKYDDEIPQKNEMYKESFMEYEKIKEKRKDLFQKLLEFVDRLNDTIDDENELNKKKSLLYYGYNASCDELKDYENQLNHCSQLIKEYYHFDKLNEETIEKMQIYFKNEWDSFIALWLEWDHKSIICYIQYLIAENQLVLSGNVNLNEIELAMKNINLNGSCFQRIDVLKSQLKLVGFKVLNDRQQIFDKIKELIMQQRINYADEGQCDNVEIAVEFLCPLTKEVMLQPVHAFDDFTYEKHAIISYLKKHKKSPMTNEACNGNEFMLLPNRKIEQKIQTFLYMNPQITVNNIKTAK